MARIGIQLNPMTDVKGNITNIDFLENMFKPIWKGSLTDLDGFLNKLVKDSINNPNNFVLQHNISDNRLVDIRNEISTDYKQYVESIVNTNNMIELKALLSVVIQETYTKYTNKELESYPFADRALFDAFENKQGSMKGKNTLLKDNAFEKIVINTNTLTTEQRTKLLEIIKDKVKFQSMFSAIKVDGKDIEVLFSRHGLLEYTKNFSQSKSTFSYSTSFKNSSDSNQRSIKFFEILANEYNDLIIDLKYGNSKISNTISSNEILLKEDEHIQKILEDEKLIDEKLKGINSSERNPFRGSLAPSSNIEMEINKNNINNKEEIVEEIKAKPLIIEAKEDVIETKKEIVEETPKVVEAKETKPVEIKEEVKASDKVNLTKVVNVEKSTIDDMKNEWVRLETEKKIREIVEAKDLADRLSVDFIGYLNQGKSIEDINKLLMASARNNESAVNLAKALAIQTLNGIKSDNEKLVEENNNYSEALEKAKENIIKAIDVIKAKDNEIVELTNSYEETINTQKDSFENIIGENLKTIETISNDYNDAVEKGNELFDNLTKANETIESRDNTIKVKDAEMIALSSEFVKQTQLKDKEIAKLKEQLESKISIINELDNKVSEQVNSINELNIKVSEQVNSIDELTKLNTSKDTKIYELDKETIRLADNIVELNKTIESNKIDLSKFESNISDLNTKINELNKLVNDSKTTIETKDKEIVKAIDVIKSKDNEIVKEKELVVSKSSEIVNLKNTIAERERDLIDVNNRLELELKKSFNKPQLDKVEKNEKVEFEKIQFEKVEVAPKVVEKIIETPKELIDYEENIKEQSKILGLQVDPNKKTSFDYKKEIEEQSAMLGLKSNPKTDLKIELDDKDPNSKNHKQ